LNRLLRFAVAHYVAIPIGATAGLLWANIHGTSYFQFAHAISFLVNSVGMALFFAVVTQEVLEAGMPGGVLHSWRRAGLPLVAAAGGLLGSTISFAAFLELVDERMLAQAWPTAGAIDMVISYFVARLVFGDRGSVAFALLLAVASNVAVFLMVGVVSSSGATPNPAGPIMLAIGIATAFALRRRGEHRPWPYLVVSGALCWCGFYWSGLHPSLALVPVVPFLSRARRRSHVFDEAGDDEAAHPATHLEKVLAYPVQVVLFLFTLANGGVVVQNFDPGAWAVTVAAVIGRPAGVVLAVTIAVALGMRRPEQWDWRHVVVVAFVVSIGFPFALFVATAILPPGALLTETKAGAIATVVGFPLAIAAASLLRVGRFAGLRKPAASH
jgi:NhaA family Na+:H+ antiporter